MKLIHSIFTTIIAIAAINSFGANAQQPEAERPESAEANKWIQEYRQYKQAFLTSEMDLTKEQQEEFFPLYEEMEDKVLQLNRTAKETEAEMTARTDEPTDEEYLNVAKELAETKGREAELETEYFDKFSKILSPKQLFELKRAEDRFSRTMLRHHKMNRNRKN